MLQIPTRSNFDFITGLVTNGLAGDTIKKQRSFPSEGRVIMSVSKTRGILYKAACLLGDFSAVSSGSPKKITKRVGRRVAGRATGKAMRKLFK